MKATVIVAYTDRLTREVCRVGEVVDEPEGRIAELVEGGFVEAKRPATKKPAAKRPAAKKA